MGNNYHGHPFLTAHILQKVPESPYRSDNQAHLLAHRKEASLDSWQELLLWKLSAALRLTAVPENSQVCPFNPTSSKTVFGSIGFLHICPASSTFSKSCQVRHQIIKLEDKANIISSVAGQLAIIILWQCFSHLPRPCHWWQYPFLKNIQNGCLAGTTWTYDHGKLAL